MKKQVSKLTLEQEDVVYRTLKRILKTQDYPEHVHNFYYTKERMERERREAKKDKK